MGRGELREVPQREELPAGDHGPGLPALGPRRRGRDSRGGGSRAPEHAATAQGARLVPRCRRDLTSETPEPVEEPAEHQPRPVNAPADYLGRSLHDRGGVLGRQLRELAKHEGCPNAFVHVIERFPKEPCDVHLLRPSAAELRPFCARRLETALRIEPWQECLQRDRLAAPGPLPLHGRLPHRDPAQPGPDAGPARPGVGAVVGGKERLACNLFGIRGRSADVPRDPIDGVAVPRHQRGKCRAATLPRVLGEYLVGHGNHLGLRSGRRVALLFEPWRLDAGREQRRRHGRQLRQRERGCDDPQSDEDCGTGPELERLHGKHPFGSENGLPVSGTNVCGRDAARQRESDPIGRVRSAADRTILCGSGARGIWTGPRGLAEKAGPGDDIAEAAVAALTDDRHVGEVYELTGPRLLTFAEAIEEIAKATRRTLRYLPIPIEQYTAVLAQLLPGPQHERNDTLSRARGRGPSPRRRRESRPPAPFAGHRPERDGGAGRAAGAAAQPGARCASG